MFELSSIEKAEKTTFCGIGFWKPCRTVIQLETLNKQIKNIRENPSFYIKEKPQRRRCSQYSCGKEAVIEFRNCSHCMCEDCVSVKVSSGETMICGGWFYCNNEIPTEFVMDYLHNIGNVENRTPTGYTRDVCDNPNCPAESLLKRDIRQRFSCEHKLCIVCVSAQRTSGDDEIICKVPTCASSKIRQTDSEIAGIPNIGLTCYASCVLQVLAQTPRFNDSLRTYSPDSDKDDVETMLKELLKSVNDVSGREFYVNWNLMQRLMRKIFQIDRSFRQYQENDCHSFIMALFNALMKTEQDHKKDVGNSFLDGPDPDDDSGTGKGTENITNDGRPKAEADIGNTTGKSTCPTALFESRLTSQFKYSSCTDTENVDDQLFYSLLLPAVVEVKSIAEGLDLYFKSEEFPDNMLPCRKCKTQNDRTTTTRTLLVSKAPDMLMIQLARFREVTYFDDHYKELEKTDHQVKFEETLTIKKAYTMDKKELEYELYGVVLHSGNMHGGHYTSCVRNLKSKKWYSCSDSSVREMPEKSLLQPRAFSNAYLLFYSKKK
ncbi:ubiquitin carboxyl-terminal hydrolase Usp2-like isoform X2 [Pecten maximus]|uniref:ubiquitin carboxyl-terminal hydrolase Usp2-like isoform X2 n=1 Tax=Pecten maximus TaxID=6579 RepID=UPI001458A6D0|nr:ubiquitin carboxyl-terminal hydrolase Usp2-like isoform X2 [Pecten maximus]